jgi:hypothetical protein
MTSSYSSDLKLELMVTGENAGTWGDKTNNNLNLVQQAIAGFEQVTLSDGGTLALVMTDGTISNARNLVIKFATITLSGASICTIPDSIEKFYIFDCRSITNPTNLTIKTASGTGFTLDQAKIYAAYSDGTNLNEISLDTLGGTVAAANLTGTISTSQIADDAVTYAKIQDTTTANRVLGAASAGAVGEVQVATDMVADDAITAAKLEDTTVSAGSYTAASITVDAQGRLTAASSGAAASAPMILTFADIGPNSGTFTAQPNSSKVHVYMRGGGGGGGGHWALNNNNNGGRGGDGGFGFFSTPISQPYAVPYSLGQGGPRGNAWTNSPQQSGAQASAGQASNFVSSPTVTFAANGGNAGNGAGNGNGNPGNPGGTSSATYGYPTSINTSQNYFFMGAGSGGLRYQANTAPNPNGTPDNVYETPGKGGLGSDSGQPTSNARSGVPGSILVYEDLG